MTGRVRSSDRLRELMTASDHPLTLYQTETLYHVQVDYTCQLLDVVDEVCDEVTAGLITDAIYGRLSGAGAAEADRRVRKAREAVEQLSRKTIRFPPGVLPPPRTGPFWKPFREEKP